MTNTYNHAKRELELLFSTIPDSIIKDFESEILMICEKFGKCGHSGGSASILSDVIKKLCLFETVTPIIGGDDEWNDISVESDEKNGTIFQNKRNSAVFKNGKNAYYIDAIIKKDQEGHYWSGSFWLNEDDYKTGNNKLKIKTRGYIKSFPFYPKTFYIDVIDVEVSKDNWESFIKDANQLNEIKEYYHLDISDFREEKINNILNV